METPDFLDTNTLTVKNRTAYDYVLDRINTANTFTDFTGLSFEHIRNYQTTITKDKIPGWSIEELRTSSNSGDEEKLFVKSTFIVLKEDDRMFSFWTTSEPLITPKILAIAQQMIDSFKFIE